MNLGSSDLKNLRIFLLVAESSGFANAQFILNKDASTISRAVATLESRLGLTLCTRGRQGFALTDAGRAVQEEGRKILLSLRSFENKLDSLKNEGGGRIAIGIIDNIVGDSAFRLHEAIRNISTRFNDQVELAVYVESPYELERQLLRKDLDIAIGIFDRHHEALVYQDLYFEEDRLYCAPQSAIGQLLTPDFMLEEAQDLLSLQNFVARNFLNESDLQCLGFPVVGDVAYTSNVEAIALMIMSGKYLGFLPCHYARSMVDEGALIPVFPDRIRRASLMQLVLRKGDDHARNVVRHSLEMIHGCIR
ncbi:TPA: LysR family transcriptional regulator [Klebsiella variicola]|uniref:LysR family transcriptional regulator n=1 Tax=Klebsiella pneumoniae TaxID=573 RepID=UPI0015EA9FBA|nr:LysR family transcriptional regulator [Klebsiella pneumoniae]EIY5386369.1 LysR family transcriptional regulator [Klebsiella variicola]MDU4248890.1 LysR family transcriptional regulator [Thomasclavelia ramosa]QLR70942.1 LysR family transcriptional regulator [Klebsiella pneumoniae]QLR70967.1 LysR family transcriptional regulator [Klebsiella pneumoniae]HBX9977308.1 LysR family transcriptional regulator [Klebsiella variicola]